MIETPRSGAAEAEAGRSSASAAIRQSEGHQEAQLARTGQVAHGS